MPKHDLHLYVDTQFASPYAMSAFVALHEKGVAFKVSTVDLGAQENQRAVFAAMSLTQRVPTLVHNGFALSESSAIAEYVNEVFPGPSLYPMDSHERARARQVQAWLRSDLMPIRVERSTEVVFYRPSAAPLSNAARESAAKLFTAVEALLKPSSKYLFEQWSIADVDLALMLNRLILNGDDVPERLARYAQRQWARPTVQLWVNQERPPLEQRENERALESAYRQSAPTDLIVTQAFAGSLNDGLNDEAW